MAIAGNISGILVMGPGFVWLEFPLVFSPGSAGIQGMCWDRVAV